MLQRYKNNHAIQSLVKTIEKDTPQEWSVPRRLFRTLPADEITETIKYHVMSNPHKWGPVISLRIIVHYSEDKFGIEISDDNKTATVIWMENLVEPIGAAWSPTVFIRAVKAEMDLMSRIDDVCDILNNTIPDKAFFNNYKYPYAPFILSDISCFKEWSTDEENEFCNTVQEGYKKAFPQAISFYKEAKEKGCNYYEIHCKESEGSSQCTVMPAKYTRIGHNSHILYKYRHRVILAVIAAFGLVYIGRLAFIRPRRCLRNQQRS